MLRFFREKISKNAIVIDFNQLLLSSDVSIPPRYQQMLDDLFNYHDCVVEFEPNKMYEVKIPGNSKSYYVILSHGLVRRISKEGKIVYQGIGEYLGEGSYGKVNRLLFIIKKDQQNEKFKIKTLKDVPLTVKTIFFQRDYGITNLLTEAEVMHYMHGAKPAIVGDGRGYIVTYEHPGKTLRSYFADKEIFELHEACHIISKLLEQVKKLYNGGYVHGDLSRNNVLYDRESGKVNVIDFGSSEPQSEIWRTNVLDCEIENLILIIKSIFKSVQDIRKQKYELCCRKHRQWKETLDDAIFSPQKMDIIIGSFEDLAADLCSHSLACRT